MVDNLEKRLLVRRERGPADRRYITVHVTPEGRELIETIFPGQVQAIMEAFSALSPAEQDELDRLCKKLGLAQQAPGAPAQRAGLASRRPARP